MCAPTTSQYAAVEALKNGDEDVQNMREAYNQRRRYLVHAFKEMGLECFEPFGAFYMFPCIKEFGMTSDEFAEKLPDKWNTDIGENGCELSGGERQRISIARAFLKDAPIILLDEATASLDVENETAIQTALSRLIRNKTVLVIAHRMRTVAGADKIVVLSDGVVAEQGTPEKLLNKNGIFKRMADLQLQGQNWTVR